MKEHRGITEEERMRYGVVREWDASAARNLQIETTLLWVHMRRAHYSSLLPDDARLIRTLKVVKIDARQITTDFGDYSLETGKNIFSACGCKRFCDCYGRLYLPNDCKIY